MTLTWKQYCYFSVEEIDQATYNVIKILKHNCIILKKRSNILKKRTKFGYGIFISIILFVYYLYPN